MELRVLKIPELQNKLVGNLSNISPGTVWSSTEPGQSKELKCVHSNSQYKGLGMSDGLPPRGPTDQEGSMP